jgi:hypothetical protein
LDNSIGVVRGPHPPPPVASANPAINPNGIACFVDILLFYLHRIVHLQSLKQTFGYTHEHDESDFVFDNLQLCSVRFTLFHVLFIAKLFN